MADVISIKPALQTFPHRRNPDGTYDSICPDCARTVASAFFEICLLTSEQQHCCDPEDIKEIWGPKRARLWLMPKRSPVD